MSCGFDKEKLTGYFDGELDAAGKAEVERHIGACSECLRQLGEIKSAAALVKNLPRLRAPRSLADGVSREIAASGGRVHSLERSRRRLWWLTVAAAGAFVSVNLWYFATSPQGQGRPAPAPMLGATKVAKSIDRGPDPAGNLESLEKQKGGALRRAAESKDAAADTAPAKGLREEAAKKVAEEKPRVPDLVPVPKEAAPLAKADEKAEAPVPAAKPAAPPAPPPAADAAKPAAARAEAKAAPPPVPPALTLALVDGKETRAKLDEILAKYMAPRAAAEPETRGRKATFPLDERDLVLELTPETYEILRREVEKAGEARLLMQSPEDPLLARLAAPKGPAVASGGRLASKEPAAPRGFSGRASEREAGGDGKVQVRITVLRVRELPTESRK
jgi:hypothetical protein